MVCGDGFYGRLLELCRGREVGESLRQIDCARRDRQTSHLADDALCELRCSITSELFSLHSLTSYLLIFLPPVWVLAPLPLATLGHSLPATAPVL